MAIGKRLRVEAPRFRDAKETLNGRANVMCRRAGHHPPPFAASRLVFSSCFLFRSSAPSTRFCGSIEPYAPYVPRQPASCYLGVEGERSRVTCARR